MKILVSVTALVLMTVAVIGHVSADTRGSIVSGNVQTAQDGNYEGLSGPGASNYGQVTAGQARGLGFNSDGEPGRGGEVTSQISRDDVVGQGPGGNRQNQGNPD